MGYLARRLAALVPVLLGISGLAFLLGRLEPGDPAEAILAGELERPPTAQQVAAFRHVLGLDQPMIEQYWHWLVGALHGDLGTSYQTNESVVGILAGRLPATILLSTAALVLSVLVAVPLGTWAALRRSRWPDTVTRTLSVGSSALPSFWVGYLLIIIFAVNLSLLPAQGNADSLSWVLPVLTLTIAIVGVPLRLVRASVLEVLDQDHVRTARAVGIPERRVLLRHVLRNALNPVVTYLGLLLGFLLSGVVVVESVFAWPGIGLAVTDAIHARDYPVVQGFVLFTGAMFVLVNLSVDLLYRRLDPRVRLGSGADRLAHG